MSGFRKAKAEQAALKVGIYGPPGSGKSFTALLLGEGLAAITKKRIAYVDTERGTDFYAKHVPERQVHPEAFDFDALYTRSLTEVVKECKALDPRTHGVVVLDSITHLWEAAIGAYSGQRTSIGTIPMQAWGGIKKPYKELMHWLLNTPMHAFILGRQGNEWAADEEKPGEMTNVGYKMKAEGETAYEPHVLIRMTAVKPMTPGRSGKSKTPKLNSTAIPTAFIEKDRTGVLFGQLIEWPDFDSIARPLLGLLGETQAHVQSEGDAAMQDAEALEGQGRERAANSVRQRARFEARFTLAEDMPALTVIGKEITAELKRQMMPVDVAALKEAFQAREAYLKSPNGRVLARPIFSNGQQPYPEDDGSDVPPNRVGEPAGNADEGCA